MKQELDNEKKVRPRGLTVIALWLMLLMLGGIKNVLIVGKDIIVSPINIIEWAYYLCCIVSAIGLLRLKEWARRCAVGLLVVHFLAAIAGIYYLVGFSWQGIIVWQSSVYGLPPEQIKSIIAAMVVIYVVWQIIALFYLTNPKIKALCSNN